MKRLILVLLVGLGLVLPGFSEWRFDIEVDIPRGLGTVAGNQLAVPQETVDFFNTYPITFPALNFSYAFPVTEWFRVGVGVRVFTFIIMNVGWLNSYAELDFWNLTLLGQLGGGVYGLILGPQTNFGTGRTLFPDISLWYRFGKMFRLGVGAIGVLFPDADQLGFAYYLGARWVIPLK